MIKVYFDGARWVITQFGVVKARLPWKDEANLYAFLLRQRGMDALRFWREELEA